MVHVLKEMKGLGCSYASLELITASVKVGIQIMARLCQSSRWIGNASRIGLSIVVPIFK